MFFKWDITFGNILTIITIIITLWIFIYNVRKAIKTQRAQLLKDFVLRFNENKDLKKTFFSIEWGKFKVDPHSKKFPCSETERKLTMLIDFLDTVTYHEKKVFLNWKI